MIEVNPTNSQLYYVKLNQQKTKPRTTGKKSIRLFSKA